MTTYRLTRGATLAIRVDGGPWQTITFDKGNLANPTEATAEELAAVIDTVEGVTAYVNGDGRLVMATEATGETSAIDIAPTSTAAAALGLGGGAGATGAGPGHARLIGIHKGPFAFGTDASMTVHVDGKARKVSFRDHEGHWTAVEAAENVNRKFRREVARVTGDGRVQLVSPTQGVGSRLAVTAPVDDVPDAATVLGFVGDAAHSEPYRTEPARLACRPAADTVAVENLTSAPIELQLPTGRCVLPARGRLVVARDTAADGLLLRLAAQGAVRMSPEGNQ